jgi:hypothetical protein
MGVKEAQRPSSIRAIRRAPTVVNVLRPISLPAVLASAVSCPGA